MASHYFVKPTLHEKKIKAYKKKHLQHLKSSPSTPLPNDDRDDSTFNYSNLLYPIHPIPMDIYNSIPSQKLQNLPSSTNPIIRNKYSTQVDSRSYLTTFEYKINGISIIWDYNTGYVHLTGIWKSLGNSKADILNLLDNAPELEPFLKRVRGGFLKIQGSWLNFDNCYKLACKICWDIRFALVPVFGVKFLDDVLKPGQLGYGELKLNSYMPGDPNDKTNENKKKRKKLHGNQKDGDSPADKRVLKRTRKSKSPTVTLESSISSSLSSLSSSSSSSSSTSPTSGSPPITTGYHATSPDYSNEEYSQMIAASNSLRKLKYSCLQSSTSAKKYTGYKLPSLSSSSSSSSSFSRSVSQISFPTTDSVSSDDDEESSRFFSMRSASTPIVPTTYCPSNLPPLPSTTLDTYPNSAPASSGGAEYAYQPFYRQNTPSPTPKPSIQLASSTMGLTPFGPRGDTANSSALGFASDYHCATQPSHINETRSSSLQSLLDAADRLACHSTTKGKMDIKGLIS